jgi:hypothetical protein
MNILGVLAVFGKMTIIFIMSVSLFVCLSVCPSFRMENLGSYWTDFYDIQDLGILLKMCWEILSFIKSGPE